MPRNPRKKQTIQNQLSRHWAVRSPFSGRGTLFSQTRTGCVDLVLSAEIGKRVLDAAFVRRRNNERE